MTVELEGLKEFRESLKQLEDGTDEIARTCAKELAARMLAKAVKRTPVGQYPESSGKRGGTLRRGWTGGKGAANVLPSLDVHYASGNYSITVANPVEYASYVEYGHRTRGGKSWVPGRFMMTISAKEVEQSAPAVLEQKLRKMLGDYFDGSKGQ